MNMLKEIFKQWCLFSDIQVINESQPLIQLPDLIVETQVDTDNSDY
jgi:hypothetical protein